MLCERKFLNIFDKTKCFGKIFTVKVFGTKILILSNGAIVVLKNIPVMIWYWCHINHIDKKCFIIYLCYKRDLIKKQFTSINRHRLISGIKYTKNLRQNYCCFSLVYLLRLQWLYTYTCIKPLYLRHRIWLTIDYFVFTVMFWCHLNTNSLRLMNQRLQCLRVEINLRWDLCLFDKREMKRGHCFYNLYL